MSCLMFHLLHVWLHAFPFSLKSFLNIRVLKWYQGFLLKFFETEILHFEFSVTKLIGHPKQNSNLLSNKSK